MSFDSDSRDPYRSSRSSRPSGSSRSSGSTGRPAASRPPLPPRPDRSRSHRQRNERPVADRPHAGHTYDAYGQRGRQAESNNYNERNSRYTNSTRQVGSRRPEDPRYNNMDRRPADRSSRSMDRRPVDSNRRPVDPNRRPVDRNGRPIDRNRRPVDRNGRPVERTSRPDPRRSGSRRQSAAQTSNGNSIWKRIGSYAIMFVAMFVALFTGKSLATSGKKQKQQMSYMLIISFVVLLLCVLLLTRCGKKEKEPAQEVSVPIEETSIIEEPEEEPEQEPAIPTMDGIANVDSTTATATYFYTYGTHYNITGETKNLDNVKNVYLVLRSLNREEDVYSYEMAWESRDDGIWFESSEMINNGINLEILPTGHYAWLLKAHLRDGSDVYRHIIDGTDQEPITYYTITQNGINREIVMENTYDNRHGRDYYGVTIQECELPEDIYDFVVDAGHGGNDGGAVGGDYTEAQLTLETAFHLKEDLEALGYKVCLSRDGTEPADEWMAFTMYRNPDGRVTKACASRAKFGVSLHLNAVEQDLEIGGLQVYTTARGNYDLAAAIAQGIKANTNCHFSPSEYNKKTDGVYIKCEQEYNPADVLSNVDALFMIRELGGVAAGAYMAGTEKYDPNVYRDSSQGVEALLLELGYITEEYDRESIANNTEGYAQGICDGIDQIAKQTAAETKGLIQEVPSVTETSEVDSQDSSETSVVTITPQ